MFVRVTLTVLITVAALSCTPGVGTRGEREASEVRSDSLSWIERTLASMTLEEKVGQLMMVRSYGHYLSADNDEYLRIAGFVRDKRVGGLIMAQGDVYEEAVLIERLQQLAKVPLLVSADLERGLAMRVRRTTSFPDAMAIGATRNPRFAYEAGRATAEEARALGIHQNYAPVADVNTNPANPVINTRSFGDDVALVRSMVSAYVKGTQDAGVIATAKHFPGHGDTGIDSHLDLPVLDFPRARLDSVELAAFRAAMESGALSVMVGHLGVPAFDPMQHIPTSLSHTAITRVLRNDLKFDGLVVTDALEMQGVVRGFSSAQAAVMAVQAGVDILLAPADEEVAIDALMDAVRNGAISEGRIEESVRRILRLKQWLRLDRQRSIDRDAIPDHVGTRGHLALAREIARSAITVIRNQDTLLPLPITGNRRILTVVISDTDENRTEVNRSNNPWPNEPAGAYFTQLVRRRCGNGNNGKAWVRLTPSSDDQDFEHALGLVNEADVVLLPLYVKVRTSSGRIGLPDNMAPFVERLRKVKTPAIVVSFGNPYVVSDFPTAQVLMCAYGDAEVLVEAAVEALCGEIDVRGRLPVAIPGLFAHGTGIELAKSRLRRDDPALAGFDPARLREVDGIIAKAHADSAFPAAQLVVVKDGLIVHDKAYGTSTYEATSREINRGTLFDLASVTKVVATTAAAMKLYDQGRLGLDDHISTYVPQFGNGDKKLITIRHLLLHRSGFPPFRRFFEFCRTEEEAIDSIFATPLVARPGDSTIYSDLGMITMGKVIEKISGMPLNEFVRREFYGPLGMRQTMFNPPQALWANVAPTEVDTIWRKRLVCGTVHDENAALLGGVSGHAGLFSTASDLAVFVQMLMNKGAYGGVRYLDERTVGAFLEAREPRQQRWLGWDMKSPTGSSAGELFSSSSFGHTGFTGTSIWADPERNLLVILLANRVYPTRANHGIYRVRPAIHNAVVRALMDAVPAGTTNPKN